MQATDLARARVTRARFRPRHPPATGPLTVAHCVSALKSLADKGASIIDYMRKAGKFDDATVNELADVRAHAAIQRSLGSEDALPIRRTRKRPARGQGAGPTIGSVGGVV